MFFNASPPLLHILAKFQRLNASNSTLRVYIHTNATSVFSPCSFLSCPNILLENFHLLNSHKSFFWRISSSHHTTTSYNITACMVIIRVESRRGVSKVNDFCCLLVDIGQCNGTLTHNAIPLYQFNLFPEEFSLPTSTTTTTIATLHMQASI